MREILRTAPPLAQVAALLLIGFGAMVALWVVAVVPFIAMGYGLETLTSIATLSPDDTAAVMMLKTVQLVQAVGLFLVPYVIFRRVMGGQGYAVVGISRSNGVALLVFAVAVMASFPLVNFLAEWNAGLTFPIESIDRWIQRTEANAEAVIRLFLAGKSVGGLVTNLFVIALIPAVAEELLFRGTVQPLMLRFFRGNAHLAVWVTAFLFSFLHLQFLGFFPRLLLGAVLGYAAHWSGSLALPVAGHFAHNALAVLVVWFIGLDALPPEVETLGADGGDVLLVAASAVALAGGMWVVNLSSLTKSRKNHV